MQGIEPAASGLVFRFDDHSANEVAMFNYYIIYYMYILEEGRSAFKMLTGKPTGKRLLEGVSVDGRTILG